MKIHTLQRETLLPVSAEEAWTFFSNPANLRLLTPAEMAMRITSRALPSEIYEGLQIAYQLKPLFHIPVNWLTEIESVQAPQVFVDVQRKGPYAYWRHVHTFIVQNENQVLMRDELQYALPMGWLGRTLMLGLVQKKLEQIFNFRSRQIALIFNK